MMDMRLKTALFALDGKTYTVCCNMNVLADVQEAFDGDLNAALSSKTSIRFVLECLAAMLNDSADSNGWPERFTARQLGRKLSLARRTEVQDMVLDLFLASCASDAPSEGGDTEHDEKNGEARPSETVE